MHLSQIFLTLGLTFIVVLPLAVQLPPEGDSTGGLLVAVDDSTAVEIVRRQLHDNTIFRENLDVVLTHLA